MYIFSLITSQFLSVKSPNVCILIQCHIESLAVLLATSVMKFNSRVLLSQDYLQF
jgi:hypothetical protein